MIPIGAIALPTPLETALIHLDRTQEIDRKGDHGHAYTVCQNAGSLLNRPKIGRINRIITNDKMATVQMLISWVIHVPFRTLSTFPAPQSLCRISDQRLSVGKARVV